MICDECETVAHCMKNGCVPKTTKKDEALRLALEALEGIHPGNMTPMAEEYWNKAITALREALNASLAEQPAPPPECQTEAEKTAFAFGWFKALESVRQQPAPVQQEPVAWMIWTHGPVLVFMNKDEANMEFDRLNHAYPEPVRMLVPLYTSPSTLSLAQRPWVGLTDEEIQAIWRSSEHMNNVEVCRAIEAKLKEKNSD